MSKGIALHIGINQVDNNSYGVQIPSLFACENDALALEQITKKCGFQTQLLLSAQATTTTIIKEIKESAKQLKSGDTFFLSYSGHGSQIPDLSGDEFDRKDECWIAFDKPLLDDELRELWSLFKEGVKIIFISDSCHSGTMIRSQNSEVRTQNYELNQNKSRNKNKKLSRFLPTSLMSAIYSDQKKLSQMKTKLAKLSAKEIEPIAGIISLSACQDKQVALEGENYGLFTESLLKIINSNQNPKRGQKPKRLTASYLVNTAKQILKGKQTPTYSKLGNIPRTFLMESIF